MAVDPRNIRLTYEIYNSATTYPKGRVVYSSSAGLCYYSLKDDNSDALTVTESWLAVAAEPAAATLQALFDAMGGKGQLLYSNDTDLLVLPPPDRDQQIPKVQADRTLLWEDAAGATDEAYNYVRDIPSNVPCQLFSDDQANEPGFAFINGHGQVMARGWGIIGIPGKVCLNVYQEKGTIAVVTSDSELWVYTNNSAYTDSANHNKWYRLNSHVSRVILFHPNYETRNTDTPSNMIITRNAGTDINNVTVSAGDIYYLGLNTNNIIPGGNPVTSFTRIGAESNFETVFVGKNNKSFYAIKEDSERSLWVWGENSNGELGLGEASTPHTTDVDAPMQNTNLKNVDAIETAGSPDGNGVCIVMLSGQRASAGGSVRELFVFGHNGTGLAEEDSFRAIFGEGNPDNNSYPQEPAVGLYHDVFDIQGSHSQNSPAFVFITSSNLLYGIGDNSTGALNDDTSSMDTIDVPTQITSYATQTDQSSGGANIPNVGVDYVLFIGGDNGTTEETALIFHSNGQIFGRGYNVDDIITQSYDEDASVSHLTNITGVGQKIVQEIIYVLGGTTSELILLDSDGLLVEQEKDNTYSEGTSDGGSMWKYIRN